MIFIAVARIVSIGSEVVVVHDAFIHPEVAINGHEAKENFRCVVIMLNYVAGDNYGKVQVFIDGVQDRL